MPSVQVPTVSFSVKTTDMISEFNRIRASANDADDALEQLEAGFAKLSQEERRQRKEADKVARALKTNAKLLSSVENRVSTLTRAEKAHTRVQRDINKLYESEAISLAKRNRLLEQARRKYTEVGRAAKGAGGGLRGAIGGVGSFAGGGIGNLALTLNQGSEALGKFRNAANDAGNTAIGRVMFGAGALAGAGVGAGLFAITFALASVNEELTLMDRKLVTLTKDQDAFDTVVSGAAAAGLELENTVNVVGRFAIATDGAFDTERLVGWTKALSQAGRVAGATTQEMQSANLQISQALASGVLQGDELRSIRESMPLLAKEIAATMGVGLGALKALGAEGKLTTEVMIESLDNLRTKSDEMIEGMPKTLAMQGNTMRAEWTLLMKDLTDSMDKNFLQRFRTALPRATTGVISSIRESVFGDASDRANRRSAETGNQISALEDLRFQQKRLVEQFTAGEVSQKSFATAMESVNASIIEQQKALGKQTSEVTQFNTVLDESNKKTKLTTEEKKAATKAAEEAAAATTKEAAALDRLLNKLDPARAALAGYTTDVGMLDAALAKGQITEDQYLDSLLRVNAALDKRAGLLPEPVEIKVKTDTAEKEVEGFFDTFTTLQADAESGAKGWITGFSDTLADSLLDGKANFADFTEGVLRDITRMITKQIVLNSLMGVFGGGGGAAAAGGSSGGGFASLFGFAQGGSFNVGGSGGTDSKTVAFRATPGERVTIEPSHMTGVQSLARTASKGSGGGNVYVNIENNGAPVDAQVNQQDQGMDKMITVMLSAVATDVVTNGPVGQAIDRTRGVQQQAVTR